MIKILHGDNREVLKTLADESVHCFITSPSYFGLRDYGTGTWSGGSSSCDHVVGEMRRGLGLKDSPANTRGGAKKVAEIQDIKARAQCPKCGAVRIDRQIGLEDTPEEYVGELVKVFREVRRILRKDGVLFLNLGDSYAASRSYQVSDNKNIAVGASRHAARARPPVGLKEKDRIGIPHMVVFALRADGWYWRDEIVWFKPNPMTESVRDRCTKAHEFVFMLSKSGRYYYDNEAIKEAQAVNERTRRLREHGAGLDSTYDVRRNQPHGQVPPGENGVARSAKARHQLAMLGTRNKRSVWIVATNPFAEAHFATFPPKLIEPAIKAGTSEYGCCVSCSAPFARVVRKGAADLQHQRACGGDANGEYTGMSEKSRINGASGAQDPSEVKARILEGMREKITIGWHPTCTCNLPALPKYPRRPRAKAERPAWEEQCRAIDVLREAACKQASLLIVTRPVVCDPFGGAGTVGLVADRHHCDAILIDLNSSYVEMSGRRITGDSPLFAQVQA